MMDRTKRPTFSMFHRRLLLIAGVMLFVVLGLMTQYARLAVVEGAEWRLMAERSLEERTLLPTSRGTIIDRRGREIALDRPAYGIAVEYDVITGAWEFQQAQKQAQFDFGKSRWEELSPEARIAEAEAHLPEAAAKTDRLVSELRRLGGIDSIELERRFDAIRGSVQALSASVWANQRHDKIKAYGEAAATKFDPQPILEQTEAHLVLPLVSNEVAFEFRSLATELPGMFEVVDTRVRDYPWMTADVPLDRSSLPTSLASEQPIVVRVRGVADHILGSMRNVQAEDIQQRPFRNAADGAIDLKGYRPIDDTAGSFGLEQVFEEQLRGTRGQVHRRLDTGESVRVSPMKGDALTTSLDIVLQARIQAILSHEFGLTRVQQYHKSALPVGMPLNSAAVVLEVETGEILAMVSMPTIAMGEMMSDAEQIASVPWVNRAAEAVYPPGSIIKPLVLTAAVTEGVHRLNDNITCTGHFFPHLKDAARCWIYRDEHGLMTHGDVGAAEAIAKSCNIYFYTLADRLGMRTLSEWLRRFSLGRPLGVGLLRTTFNEKGKPITVGESGGDVPSESMIEDLEKRGEIQFASIILGIGQGPITWTPLHAANAYAMLARGGTVRDATLIPEIAHEQRRDDLNLDSRAVSAALDGLRQSVMERIGTGHHIRYDDEAHSEEPIINAQHVTVWAKTGTAQAPPLRLSDTNGDGAINSDDEGVTGLDHSWFVGLVGPNDTKKPMFAIAVIVEYGGSGGRVAGPIANQIIHALQFEGYLPGASDEIAQRPHESTKPHESIRAEQSISTFQHSAFRRFPQDAPS